MAGRAISGLQQGMDMRARDGLFEFLVAFEAEATPGAGFKIGRSVGGGLPGKYDKQPDKANQRQAAAM
jgi:hypothetical protein